MASPRALDSQPRVGYAEVWRVLEVDQVFPGRRLVVRIERLQLEGPGVSLAPPAPKASEVALVADQDLGGAVEAFLELVSHVPEGRQAHPACLDGAATGHAVALALPPRFRGHLLRGGNSDWTLGSLFLRRPSCETAIMFMHFFSAIAKAKNADSLRSKRKREI